MPAVDGVTYELPRLDPYDSFCFGLYQGLSYYWFSGIFTGSAIDTI